MTALQRVSHLIAMLFGVLASAAMMSAAGSAHAEGLFDFLFGGPQQPPPTENYSHPPPPAAGIGRIAPAPLGQESVIEGNGTTGHSVAFCVRLCDGRHYPMENMAKGTPMETCRASCPYSRTKVFFGSEIGGAVAADGQHYANLDTAFLYRKQLVGNCTCNGKDAFGLSAFDVTNDPTLRPGDIVSTRDGMMAYTGKSGPTAAFVPVNPATLPPDIRPGPMQPQPPSSTEPAAQNNAPNNAATVTPPKRRQPRTAPSPVIDAPSSSAR